MRILLTPIKGSIYIITGLAAVLLDAQTQPPTATMTVQVQVPSNTPPGDAIWVFGGQLFNIFTPRVPMNRVPGTSNTWQAAISAPAGTIFRYYFARNNDYSKLESYAPFWPNGYSIGPGLYQQRAPLRELLVTNGAAISETVAACGADGVACHVRRPRAPDAEHIVIVEFGEVVLAAP